MPILDPQNIPSEIKDQIEAAANTLGKGIAVYGGFAQPDSPNDDPHILLFAQGIQELLTLHAMMVLPDPAMLKAAEAQLARAQADLEKALSNTPVPIPLEA
jgi:hypothetical protein